MTCGLGRHAVLATWLSLVVACGDTPIDHRPQTVLLISVDTLRADHLGVYGYVRNTSPFLDRWASQGVVFENAVSAAPWTLPAHATLLTGVEPFRHRALDADSAISPEVKTIAELMSAAGYATGGFVTSWFVSDRYGFARGFDHFEDFGTTRRRNRRRKVRAEVAIEAATTWLREQGSQPVFLFLHLYDVHYDYSPPPPFDTLFTPEPGSPRRYLQYHHYLDHPLSAEELAEEVARYDGEIRYVDAQLEQFWDEVTALRSQPNTLAILTSDHGEEFFERGAWGHAHTLYDEQIRVPLIVVGPGARTGREPRQVRHIDLLPTLVDALVLPFEHDSSTGRSFWGLLQDPDADWEPPPAFLSTFRFETAQLGVRDSNSKVIWDLKTGATTVFDLRRDRAERENLISQDGASQSDEADQAMQQLRALAAAANPDRWKIRWEGSGEISGNVEAPTRWLDARVVGPGDVALEEEDSRVVFSLAPDAELILTAATPVDDLQVNVVDAAGTTVDPNEDGPLLLDQERSVAPGDPVALDAATRKQLESLGYLVDGG